MKKGKKIMALGIGMSVLLGGCSDMDNSKDKENVEKTSIAVSGKKNAYEKENFVRIQDYKGEGYTLRNSGTKTDKIAEAHRGDIEKAVKEFFLDTYKTEVTVHNIVGAVDGASVFVESIGEPHFYSFAIVPIDLDKEQVITDKVWSQEGQVENAIKSSLYAMVFDQEFAKLDKYLEGIVNEFPVVGTPIEVMENVGANGYSTSYYYTSTVGNDFDNLYNIYLEDPQISKQELKKVLHKNDFEPDRMLITIEFYMKEINTKPDKKIYNDIVSDLEKMEGIPRGSYSLLLNDNLIDRRRAIGTKENTLKSTVVNEIFKE